MTPHSLLRFLCLSCFLLPLSLACPPSFPCNGLGDIQFPFTPAENPECGLIYITGCDDPNPINRAQVGNQSQWNITGIYHEGEINNTFIFQVQDLEIKKLLSNHSCKTFDHSLAVPSLSPMLSFQIVPNITLFKCNHSQKIKQPEDYSKYTDCSDYDIYFDPNKTYDQRPFPLKACSSITLPVNPNPDPYSNQSDPFEILTSEILINAELSGTCFDCHYNRGGQCLPEGKFCTLDDWNPIFLAQPEPEIPPPKQNRQDRKVPKALIIGLVAGGVFVISISLLIILQIKNQRYNWSAFLNRSRSIYFDIHKSTNPECVSVDFGVPIFSYEELQKATNNFDPSRELGSGGFGTVYYGQLKDGREVAVKHLYQRKRDSRRVKQFINEIQILRCLHHRNLVSLYGCTSLHSHGLLLIYEYIPNGTVANHLHGDLAKPGSLPLSHPKN